MRSLTLKLTLAFLVVSLTGAVLASLFIQQRTRNEFSRFLSNQFQNDLISSLTQYYRQNGSWDNVGQYIAQLEPFSRMPEFTLPPREVQPPPESRRVPWMLVDANRVIVYSGSQTPFGRLATDEEIRQGVPLEIDGEVVGWLTLNPRFSPRIAGSPERNFLETVNQVILISALLTMLIGLLLGFVLARTLTRPLRELTSATQALAKGELGTQVHVRSQDEIGRLAQSFNQMSADLARATLARRQMTADVAHDLRSPLSVILGYTEALSDGKLEGTPEGFDVLHKEAGHLSRLIDDLRTLSLADSGELKLYPQIMKPSIMLEHAAAAYRPLCQQKSIILDLQYRDDLPNVEVDPERMAQVLGNLLSNALRYTPVGKRILLGAQSGPAGVEIIVEDEGPGIPVEDQPYVFERFYRADKARSHNGEMGLGLAIAKSLVEAQGGTIRLESSSGSGTRFIILLPSKL